MPPAARTAPNHYGFQPGDVAQHRQQHFIATGMAGKPPWLQEIWYLFVATVTLQAGTSLMFVRRQMHRSRQAVLA